jgi:hypothetical protein
MRSLEHTIVVMLGIYLVLYILGDLVVAKESWLARRRKRRDQARRIWHWWEHRPGDPINDPATMRLLYAARLDAWIDRDRTQK